MLSGRDGHQSDTHNAVVHLDSLCGSDERNREKTAVEKLCLIRTAIFYFFAGAFAKKELNFIIPVVLTFPSCFTPRLIFFFFASSSSFFLLLVASLSSASSSFMVLRLREMLSERERSAWARRFASAIWSRWACRGAKSTGDEEDLRRVFSEVWSVEGI